jgi:hypothetical protein
MKTLVVVLTHPEARPILEMNLPWMARSGCDIAVVHHAGTLQRNWMNNEIRYHVEIGGPPDSTPNRWLDRFLDVLQWCVSSSDADGYSNFLLCESDCIFLRPIPGTFGGIAATLAGHKSEGFLAETFWHCPWLFSFDAAQEFLRRARIMLNFNLTEHGFIDRFLGAYSELYNVPILNLADGQTYSRNTIEGYAQIQEARKAIAEGAWFLHGIKSPVVLEQITEGL